jgi:hypothetical protein
MYQIANIYLLLFAGSIWDSLAEAIDNPKAILNLISAALPKVSIFFMNYVITILLTAVPYKMIRRFCAIQYLWFRSCHREPAMTRRMLKNPAGPFGETRVSYGTELSDILYVLCVIMLYWVIAPIVLILATVLFWAWYFMWKYQYVFVITRTSESGGLFWYKIYRYSMTGLMAGTITFMAYMGIKEGVSQGPLLVPLPIIIYIAWQYTDKRFRNLSENLAFGTALKQERNVSDGDLPGLIHSSTSASTLSTVHSSSQQHHPQQALLSAVDAVDLVPEQPAALGGPRDHAVLGDRAHRAHPRDGVVLGLVLHVEVPVRVRHHADLRERRAVLVQDLPLQHDGPHGGDHHLHGVHGHQGGGLSGPAPGAPPDHHLHRLAVHGQAVPQPE